MTEFFTADAMWALFSVIAIDVALAGDNAIVVGMAAAGLERSMRRKAIVIGIVAATVMRVVFALFTTQLLEIIGLLFAGGLLLLWVSWKLWREAREGVHLGPDDGAGETAEPIAPTKSYRAAVTQIVVADISMSLDNVLAVAGAAREHVWVLVVGLILSIALMGLAANFIAGLLRRFHWIVYVGLAIILYVAGTMIWEGAQELMIFL
ncbi:MAG: TerC family protein [Alphaproteobacteria bacterium]|jgi:YjbE family integral membrane protein